MKKSIIELIVLKKLNEKSQSGYSIMKELNEELGYKPSSGSIYPILKSLKDKELIKIEINGKSNICHLNKKGKKYFKEKLINHKNEIFSKAARSSELISKDLKRLIFTVYRIKNAKNKTKISNILKETITKLSKIK